MKLARLSLAVCALASSFAFAAVLSSGTGCSSSSGGGTGAGGGGGTSAGGGGGTAGGGGHAGGGGGGTAGGGGGTAGGGGGTAGGGGSALPVITISGPASGATVQPTAGPLIDGGPGHIITPITFTVSNFTLAAPGTCAGQATCGHIHETTDGANCTQGSYNNAFVTSPGNVWLDLCNDGVCGNKTTQLELHDDNHNLYTCGGACPTGIQASISYVVDPTNALCGDGGTSQDAASE
jgi:hypothetical protein